MDKRDKRDIPATAKACDFLIARQMRVAEMCSRMKPNLGEVSFKFPTKFTPGYEGVSMPSDLFEYWDPVTVSRNPLIDVRNLWWTVLACPYSNTSSPAAVDRRDLPPFTSCNEDWDHILQGLNRVGRPSGEGEFLRPEGDWVVDLVKEPRGYEILEAAHAVAHARALMHRDSDRLRTGLVDVLAEMIVARRYGVTIHVPTPSEIENGPSEAPASFFDVFGVKVCASTNFRKPWISIPAFGPNSPRPYRTTIAILANVHLEPQPWSAREDNPDKNDKSWLEMNRWSCMPSIVGIAGWKAMDELMKFPLARPWRNAAMEDACYSAPATALDGPSTLDLLFVNLTDMEERTSLVIPGANAQRGAWYVHELIDSDYLKRLKTIVPPFPCRDCLRLNMASNGAPTRPMRSRPKDDARKADKEALQEWSEYDKKVDKIVEVVEKACEFYDCRFVYGRGGRKARRLRKSNARKASELVARIASCRKREAKLRKDSELSRAAAESGKIAEFGREIVNLLYPENKQCENTASSASEST